MLQAFSYIRESDKQLTGQSLLEAMSYVILRVCWCDSVVLNVHAPTQNERDDLFARV
jgi:hypothetical protein